MSPIEELKLLRDVVGACINHLAGGGRITRGDQYFKDLKRVHRSTRDLQSSPEALQAEHWQNIACNLAFFAGIAQGRMGTLWSEVADSLLESGGENTSFAKALATLLGLELMESVDGGKTWVPALEFKVQLAEQPDHVLVHELERRGYFSAQLGPGGDRDALLRRAREFLAPDLRSPYQIAEDQRFNQAAGLAPMTAGRGLGATATGMRSLLRAEAERDGGDRPPVCTAVGCMALAVPGNTGLCERHWRESRPPSSLVFDSRAPRPYWEHRCDVDDRLLKVPLGARCDRCGEGQLQHR